MGSTKPHTFTVTLDKDAGDGAGGSSGSGGNLQSSGTSKRTKTTRQAAGAGGQIWDGASEGVRALKQNTDEYVRKNPAKAVFTALAIGFVFGLMRRG